MTIKQILTNQMYEGKTVKEAIEFCERCYGETPSKRAINSVKKIAKQAGRNTWEEGVNA